MEYNNDHVSLNIISKIIQLYNEIRKKPMDLEYKTAENILH